MRRREINLLLLIIAITGLALWIDFTPTVNTATTSGQTPAASAAPSAAASAAASPGASAAASAAPSAAASAAPVAAAASSGSSRYAPWPSAGTPWLDVHTRLGLDLRGGTQVLLRSRDTNIDAASLQTARDVIESRVNGLGVSEATVQVSGNDRIIVELPDVEQPERALRSIQSTGKLELIDPQGQYLPPGQLVRTTGSPEPSLSATTGVTGTDAISQTEELQQALSGPLYTVIADGSHLETTSVQPGLDQTGRPIVSFTFNEPSAAQLQSFTAQNIGQPLTIVLDNRVVSSATIQDVLPGSGQISSQTTEDRDNIYNVLRYGSLPVGFDVETSRTVSATLGEDSIRASLIAGIIGLLSVALLMILYYRLPGLVAVIALLIYTAISFALYKTIPITLTLAGIAGFILSIGLAVDGNVLIFARLKEELRNGRSIGSAVEEGFRHAWPSIRDSNVATLITTAILYWFGSSFGVSIIKGFALTLGLGVVVSVFTSVVITRTFLRLIVESGAFRNYWWYAVEDPAKVRAMHSAEAV